MIRGEFINVLFVCSRNRWRSPTAETLFRSFPGIRARSCGTSKAARKQVQNADIDWADLVIVMEDEHTSRLKARFRQSLNSEFIYVLDIPDEYQFMDPDLVDVLEQTVTPILMAALKQD
ncbi:hypothetical protein [Labrenzia sp. DG1229]|uniref:low molecular weight protein tyrosine phosphatase family protein n=1 Tax=Labrenzia sp. DG1229 TaxID=681847 RepID=UPI0004920CAC|nr:hypothetical protein [Labrenzia sp. DG1229]